MKKSQIATWLGMALALTVTGQASASLYISGTYAIQSPSNIRSGLRSGTANAALATGFAPSATLEMPTANVTSNVGHVLPVGASSKIIVGEAFKPSKSTKEISRASQAVKTAKVVAVKKHHNSAPILKPHAQPLMRFGKNVPISIALSNVLPRKQAWTIHYDSGLAHKRVNWNGGSSWKTIIDQIAKSNGLKIVVNNKSGVVGVSRTEVYAKALSQSTPSLWTVKHGSTLRKTVSVWAKRAGWNVYWDPDFDLDYPIIFDARLIGTFTGENGVLHQLLESISQASGQPVSAEFYTQNKVVYLKSGGFEQGDATVVTPSV